MPLKDKAIKIREYVERESWFEFEELDENIAVFTTRENGDVGSELASQIDIKEGYRIGTEVKNLFLGTSLDIEEVDEWVYLRIEIN